MGWLGPKALAAGALGTNLYFALLIFGIGLMSATAPLIAEELGRRRHSVREVRRTVRQGFWAAITVAVPIWMIGLERRGHFAGHRPGTGARESRGRIYAGVAMEPAAVSVLSGSAIVPLGFGAAGLGAGHRHAAPCP